MSFQRLNILKTEKLSKRYQTRSFFFGKQDVLAADDISIEIKKGETLGIVGESGSGKSTVARCVTRLIDVSDGRIIISGNDIAEKKASELKDFRQKVQIVFQDPYRSLNPRRTVQFLHWMFRCSDKY